MNDRHGTMNDRADEIRVVPLTATHWTAVRDIYVQGIETGGATFETEAPDWSDWDRTHAVSCRLIAARGADVVGWAAVSPVSRRPAYRGVAEVSVYVHAVARGAGIGRRLLEALVTASEEAGYWTLQASVFPENEATIRLHTSAGFRSVGYRERIGMLRGVWRDTVLLERRSVVVGVP